MNELENFYNELEEPNKSCFLFLRQFILKQNPNFNEQWKWKLPFIYYKKKPFCYFWKDKKTQLPYVCFTESLHINLPELTLGERKKMKAITILPDEDIDIELLSNIIEKSLTKFEK